MASTEARTFERQAAVRRSAAPTIGLGAAAAPGADPGRLDRRPDPRVAARRADRRRPAPPADARAPSCTPSSRTPRAASCRTTSSVTLLRVAASFVIAMAIGSAIGLAMGRVAAVRPDRPPVAGVLSEHPRAGHDRARLHLDRPGRERADLRGRDQQDPERRGHGARGRPRARPQPARDGRGATGSAGGAPCSTWCCRSSTPISPPPRAPASP